MVDGHFEKWLPIFFYNKLYIPTNANAEYCPVMHMSNITIELATCNHRAVKTSCNYTRTSCDKKQKQIMELGVFNQSGFSIVTSSVKTVVSIWCGLKIWMENLLNDLNGI